MRRNKKDNDGFYEQRVTEIRDAVRSGDPEGAARITANTIAEGEFAGDGADSLNNTASALSAAAGRLGWRRNR